MKPNRSCRASFLPGVAPALLAASFLAVAPLGALAGAKLSVRPEYSAGVPGELHAVELSVETDSPRPIALRIPPASNLVLRAVERYPVARSVCGAYIQKRLAVFQGVESGAAVMTNILVEIGGEVYRFPPLTLRVADVEKAPPPEAAGKNRSDDNAQ